MFRFLLTAAFVGLFIWFGMTVNLGRRTLFGHIANIWSSDEAQEMREDVSDKTKPLIDKARQKGGRALEAMAEDEARDALGAVDAGVAADGSAASP
jgi:hypothetical protein